MAKDWLGHEINPEDPVEVRRWEEARRRIAENKPAEDAVAAIQALPKSRPLPADLPGYRSPADRKCWQCGRTLQPRIDTVVCDIDDPMAIREFGQVVKASRVCYGYDGDGLFCSLRCGYKFACQILTRG
jgi:hypothetical protein